MNEPRQGWHLREVYFNDGEPTMHREPQQRQWVGLTEDEMYAAVVEVCTDDSAPSFEEFMGDKSEVVRLLLCAIEAKLREKNT